MSQKEEWSIEKLMVCLRRVVHPEILSSLSEVEFDENYYEFIGEAECLVFLKYIYGKSEGKLRIYGSEEVMMENFKRMHEIPEFIVFSSHENEKISCTCASLTYCGVYMESSRKTKYTSRSIIAISVFKCLTIHPSFYGDDELVEAFFQTWLTAFLNRTLIGMKGSYDLIPCNSHDRIIEDLKTFLKNKPKITIPNGTITVEWFHDLKKYFKQEEQQFLVRLINRIQPDLFTSNQYYCKKAHAAIVYLIENTRTILDRHKVLFTPSKELRANQKPTIRLVTRHDFLFAQEVNVAIRQLMKNRIFDPQLLKNLIMVESEKERKNGIVYAIRKSKFEKILKKLGLYKEDFAILEVGCFLDYQYLTFPFNSSYGTHCIPSLDAFDRIIHYLTVILKIFQRCKKEKHHKIIEWIELMMEDMFVAKPVYYLIEIWKIDEIIDRARKELSHLLTESEYEVSFKETYNKNQSFGEIAKLMENWKMDKKWFLLNIEDLLKWMLKRPIYIKDIYHGYSKMIRYYLQNHYAKIGSFVNKQIGNAEKRDSAIEEPNSVSFEEVLLDENEVPLKRRRLDQKEEVQEPSCSTENDKNRAQKFSEELEELRKNENQIEDELEKKGEDLEQQVDSENDLEKPDSVGSEEALFDENEVLPKKRRLNQKEPSCSTENDENRAQQFSEELEKLRENENELEDKLKNERKDLEQEVDSENEKPLTENDDNRDQKFEEELEKIRKDKKEVKEQLEKEIFDQKAAFDRSEKTIEELRQILATIEKAEAQLENNRKSQIEKGTVDSEEQVQKAPKELEKLQGSWSLRNAMYRLKGEKEKMSIDFENESSLIESMSPEDIELINRELEKIAKAMIRNHRVKTGCEEAKKEIEKHQESESQQEEELKTSHEMATQMTDADKMLKEVMDELEKSQNPKEDDETSDNGWVLLDDETEERVEEKIDLVKEAALQKEELQREMDAKRRADELKRQEMDRKYAIFQHKVKVYRKFFEKTRANPWLKYTIPKSCVGDPVAYANFLKSYYPNFEEEEETPEEKLETPEEK